MYIIVIVVSQLQPHSSEHAALQIRDEQMNTAWQPAMHIIESTLKTPIAGHASAVRCALLQITRSSVVHTAQPPGLKALRPRSLLSFLLPRTHIVAIQTRDDVSRRHPFLPIIVSSRDICSK
jgi:hypothetical protein